MRNTFILFSFLSLACIAAGSYYIPAIAYTLILVLPVILLGVYDMLQEKHAIMRNFPIVGRLRYILEEQRAKIYQYFIESETDGTPINRMNRSVVYQRAKKELDTEPFGTNLDVYAEGYEWINHSLHPKDAHKLNTSPKVKIGGKDCTQPYDCSVLNISAMSFGSLGARAVEAMNGGAKIGDFAQNTGEGGIAPYHLKQGGDLIWQIGTGYFGCREKDGSFSDDLFSKNANRDSVKMIEIKLSQGAKPGHGGILPGKKVTQEIAEIRNVNVGETVFSPPYHQAFSTDDEFCDFIARLRKLSNGKPIGCKLCVGNKEEFEQMVATFKKRDVFPDFIQVDGGEGGTGAAPLEFTNSIGMPYKEGLAFVHNTLLAAGIRDEIKILASGKIITGFHIARTIALGADVCMSARAMMLAIGCIQALECNMNTCPAGIATQSKSLQSGLVVKDKMHRIANYHKETVLAFVELLAAAGMEQSNQLTRKHIHRRISMSQTMSYDELYPYE